DVVDIDTGLDATCAVIAGGALRCWGENGRGQLGDGSTTDRYVPTDVSGLSGVEAVAVGGGHACALTASGDVRCWGWNAYGQLGDGSMESRLAPTVAVADLSGVASIVSGESYSCAVLTSGAMRCWGQGHYGQLGDGGDTMRARPVA